MSPNGSKIDSNGIDAPEYSHTHYEVANALGAPLPAPVGSAVYRAIVIRNSEDDPYESSLGYFASEDAALAAIANDALREIDDYGYEFPWDNQNISDDDSEYWTADAIEARRDAWLSSRTIREIVEEFHTLDDTAEVIKIVVQDAPKIG